MRAEKCPNCGAFLPVRRAGVRVRACEFCGLEVPGDTQIVEVPALTEPSTWLPPPPRVRRLSTEEMRARRPARRSVLPVLVVAAVGVLMIVGVVVAVVQRGAAPAEERTPEVAIATGGPAEAPPPPPPSPSPATVALREAVDAAGGATALDPVALLGFVDARVREVAPDALLLLVNCYPVRGDGRVDLTLVHDARCGYELRAPGRVRRPDDVPAGVAFEVPCLIGVSVDGELRGDAPSEWKRDLRGCSAHQAVEPPRCTTAEVRARAAAAGIPTDAVGRLRFGGEYRSGYEPGAKGRWEPDRPARGTWDLTVVGDDGREQRFRMPDDCAR